MKILYYFSWGNSFCELSRNGYVYLKTLIQLKQQTMQKLIKRQFLSICYSITHPLVPPLLKIEGDDHPAKITLLLARERRD